MNASRVIRTGRHCVFNLHVHLVFVTKYRKGVFTKAMLKDLKTMFTDLAQQFESQLLEFDGEDDHVHLLVSYPPKVQISKLVNSFKGVSSRRMRQLHPRLKNQYYKGTLWSPSYFAGSCGGAPIPIIRQYIESQQTPE